MGTTAEKLTYLNETKTQLKDMLNLGGASLTTEPFRQYVDTLKNRYLYFMNNGTQQVWDNWDKVEGTGETLTLNNTEEAPMSLVYKGNTYQDSTTGKNILPNDLNTTTLYGITATKNSDGSITFTGTATGTSTFVLCENKTINIDASTYVLSTHSSGSYSSGNSYFNIYDNNNTQIMVLSNTNNSISKTFSSTSSLSKATIVFGNGCVIASGGFTIYPMLEKSNTATDYEPYTNGASPNPDYPQDIHVVSGNNSIEVCGKNLFDGSKYNGVAQNTNGTYKTTEYYTSATDTIFKGKPSTTYRITLFDENGDRPSGSNPSNFSMSANGTWKNINTFPSNTFDTDTNGNAILKLGSDSWGTIGAKDRYIMINEATETPTFEDYEAYTGESYPISLGVENLWTLSDTFTSTSANQWVLGDTNFELKAGTYHLDINATINKNVAFNFKDSNNTATSIYLSSTNTITFANDIKKVSIRIDTANNTISNIRLIKGSTPQHISSTLIELLKIGTYQDKIFKNTPNTTDYDSNLEDNVWYLKKEIGKYTFTGNETLATYGGGSSRKIVDLINAYSIANSDTPLGYNELSLMTPRINIFNLSGYGISYNSNEIYVRLADKVGQDLLDLLEGTSLYYILATPTYTLIEDTTLIEQLETIKKSYEGQTNISQENNDMPFILDITALSKE